HTRFSRDWSSDVCSSDLQQYQQNIVDLLNDGFVNCVPILDNLDEIDYYLEHVKVPFQVGIRIASDEEPKFGFYTSRLGVRYKDIIELYENKIRSEEHTSELQSREKLVC